MTDPTLAQALASLRKAQQWYDDCWQRAYPEYYPSVTPAHGQRRRRTQRMHARDDVSIASTWLSLNVAQYLRALDKETRRGTQAHT